MHTEVRAFAREEMTRLLEGNPEIGDLPTDRVVPLSPIPATVEAADPRAHQHARIWMDAAELTGGPVTPIVTQEPLLSPQAIREIVLAALVCGGLVALASQIF